MLDVFLFMFLTMKLTFSSKFDFVLLICVLVRCNLMHVLSSLPHPGEVKALRFPLCRGMWRSRVHPCLSWGSLSWCAPLCSCDPSAGPQFPYWSKANAVRARQSHLLQQSCPRHPRSLCRFVARCTRRGSCPLGKHHHGSRGSPAAVVRHGIFYQRWLSLTQNDQKSESILQNLPLFTAENDVRRRKGGKWKRKLLMSLNHERLGLRLEWFGIQGSLVLWLRG